MGLSALLPPIAFCDGQLRRFHAEVTMTPRMSLTEGPLLEKLAAYGVPRRRFLQYCAGLTAVLALPPSFAPRIAHALAGSAAKPSLVWLEFQDCAGNSESFLRARD